MLKRKSWLRFVISLAAVVALVGNGDSLAAKPKLEPGEAMREFYRAVGDNDCERARSLRSGYQTSQCEATTEVEVKKVKLSYYREGLAVVYVDVGFRRGGEHQSWAGHVTLHERGDGWMIDGTSYDSNLSEDEYVAKYVPKERVVPPEPPLVVEGLTFGSGAVLYGCWSDAQLKGQSSERRVRKDSSKNARKPPTQPSASYRASELPSHLRGSIRRVNPVGERKAVALTFDLCERTRKKTGFDAAIVDYLRAHRIKATFFAGGKWMRSHPERAQQLMADPLFEIGNHAWTHGNMRVLTGEKMQEQVDWTQAQYEILRDELADSSCALGAGAAAMAKIPKIPYTFRFPYGTCNDEVLDYLGDSGLPAIQWDVVSKDPDRKQTASGITKIVLAETTPGAIVIMHANGRGHGTAGALPLFVPELIARGYEFVTVSELLELGEVVVVDECYEMEPGDNLEIDRRFGDGT